MNEATTTLDMKDSRAKGIGNSTSSRPSCPNRTSYLARRGAARLERAAGDLNSGIAHTRIPSSVRGGVRMGRSGARASLEGSGRRRDEALA